MEKVKRFTFSITMVMVLKHEVWITDPDGQKTVSDGIWNRGRQYHVEFVAEESGVYPLVCAQHAPTMIVSFLALPR